MDSFLFDLGVSVILTTIRNAVKNPAKKRELKAALLKVAFAIMALYPEEFVTNEDSE